MVKKKGKSKRTTLKDKYKIQRRVTETHRKQRKQAKKDAAAGIVKHESKKKKEPGIPNSWPFKQDLLKEIQRTRERQQQLQQENKERRKAELLALREHQQQGGTARTVQELVQRANQDQAEFAAKHQGDGGGSTTTISASGASSSHLLHDTKERSDGQKAAGQQSRRAYLRELKKVVDTADVILQVLDARDPIGTRIHSSIEDVILSRTDKKMVLVLNKIDLVPKDIVGAWLTALRRSHPAIAVNAGIPDRAKGSGASTSDDTASVTSTGTKSTAALGMDGLLQLLKNYARISGSGKSKTTIVVGVVGYPNVGKSSIINALKRCRAVGVSPRPGFTKSMQEVVLDKNVRLLDSPGVVFDDKTALLGNCVDAESVDDPIPHVTALLRRCDHASLLMTYNIPAFPPNDTMMFLAMVARSYGRVLKGGIPDKMAAARAVLKDWNHGKIPYFTPPPAAAAPEVNQDAVIVSQFGKEFDLAQFDQQVLGSLKNAKDAMDFVQLTDTATNKQDDSSMNEDEPSNIQSTAAFLAGKTDEDEEDDDDDDDEEMEDEEEDERELEGVAKGRKRLAAAEDYDFDDL